MIAIQVIYHTDYATDQLPTNPAYIMDDFPISSAYCIELSEEGKTFEGWYYTPTYDEGTKIIGGETVGAKGMENWYAKWSVHTVSSKLTAIADEIRELSGATDLLDLDEMANHVDEANAKITEQESVIANLNEALDNLGADAAGGKSMDTCTINVVITADAELTLYSYSYVDDDGKVETVYVHTGYDQYSNTTLQFTNVICGSLIVLSGNGLGSLGIDTDNVHQYQNAFSVSVPYFRAPSENGSVGTITFYSDD